MLREPRDVTTSDGVSVREESHQCPKVIWVTFPIPYQGLLTMKVMKVLKGETQDQTETASHHEEHEARERGTQTKQQ
jgi:hypothetical protein